MPLKVAFAQDLSGSFSDDIINVRAIFPDIVSEIKSYDANSEIAITSFIDKPLSPFGSPGDYVYNTDISLTSDSDALTSVYNTFTTQNGNDSDEAQLESLLQIALRETEIGWSSSDQRVVVLFTDAGFHQEGDHPGTANNYDEILDGTPAGTAEDYPAIPELGFLLRQKNIIPIFAVTEYNTSTYESLINDLGAGGGVVNLSSDSSNIVDAIKSAVRTSTGLEHLSPLSGISFREDETFKLQIRLNQQPTSNVSFTAQTSNTDEAKITEGSLTFTPDNWNAYQTLEISGIDDTDTETNQRLSVDFSPFDSDDNNFNGYTPASIFFTLTDNELTPVHAGSTFTATSASSVELNEGSTFTPSQESDTIKFINGKTATVKGTAKDLRDDIIYNFNEESELEILIPSKTLSSIAESDLSPYFNVTQGSAVIQFDANFDGDFSDIEDTIFTLKGEYALDSFTFAKSTDSNKVEISYIDPSPSSSPSPTPTPEPTRTINSMNCIAGSCSTSHNNGRIRVPESQAKHLTIKNKKSKTILSSTAKVSDMRCTIDNHFVIDGKKFNASIFTLSPKRKTQLNIKTNLLSSSKIHARGKKNEIHFSGRSVDSIIVKGNNGKDILQIEDTCNLFGKSAVSLGKNKDKVFIDGIIHKLTINNGNDTSADRIQISNIDNIEKKLLIKNFGEEDRLLIEAKTYQYSDLVKRSTRNELEELGINLNLIETQ